MPHLRLIPRASALVHALRGVGYDAKTAVADLVDNSIAAHASNVWLRFTWAGRNSTVSLLDDGHGMSAAELETAMTLGSRSPLEQRGTADLGRFGLGLKTASLSQCTRLVVSSRRKDQPVSTRVWDLSTVEQMDDWIVHDEIASDEHSFIAGLHNLASGTLVLWRQLDRLAGDFDEENESARLTFQGVARDVERHLAMTFHRFLEGPRPRLRIYINGQDEEFRIRAWDPFCTAHAATQQMPEVARNTRSGTVKLQGFVLPHRDRFIGDEFEAAAGPAGWPSQQGFYVYRNERLLVAGSWLGLGRPRRWTRDEQHKLARIRLDLPNTLDSEWSLDIKKSKANPPVELRDWLNRHAELVRQEAKEVFVHRGSRASTSVRAEFSPIWFAETAMSPRYRINRNHPLISALAENGGAQAKAVERVLRLVESTIPVHRIWLDVADKPETPTTTRQLLDEEQVARIAADLLERLMSGQNLTRTAALHRLRHIEPFDQFPELLASLEE